MYAHVDRRNLSSLIETHSRTKGISVRTGQTFLNPPNSSICDHALQSGHDINTFFFKIIRNLELNSVSISEGIHIKKFSLDLKNLNASKKLNILG